MNLIKVGIEKISDEVELPYYATAGSAGADVRAHLSQAVILAPGKSILISTGLKFEIPSGYEIQVRPRSGLAYKNQITVLNAPATIDSDYRGELKVILINHGQDPFIIEPNMRIAQIVFASVTTAQFEIKEQILVNTERGEGGFGHTGKF